MLHTWNRKAFDVCINQQQCPLVVNLYNNIPENEKPIRWCFVQNNWDGLSSVLNIWSWVNRALVSCTGNKCCSSCHLVIHKILTAAQLGSFLNLQCTSITLTPWYIVSKGVKFWAQPMLMPISNMLSSLVLPTKFNKISIWERERERKRERGRESWICCKTLSCAWN
jgi:hypothetical protein